MAEKPTYLNRINNYAMVVKLTRGSNVTICGYLIEAFDEKGPSKDDALVTFGGLIPSHDGEVRFLTVQRSQFDAITSNAFWYSVESRVIEYINDAQLDALFYFPPEVSPATKAKFKRHALSARYDVNIVVAHIYWLAEYSRVDSAHIPFITYSWLRQDLPRLDTIVRDVETITDRAKLMIETIKHVVPRQMIVIKVIPLTVNELRFIGDLRFRVWRENYVQEICGALRRANITNGFTWYWPWGLIHDIDDEMFENPFVIARFRRSEVVNAVSQGIAAARTMEVADPAASGMPAGADTRETPAILHEEFDSAMEHAAGDIRLSLTAVVFTSYAISQPFADRVPKTLPALEQIVFDWFYEFLLLHEKVGAIHADAHVRNLCVRETPITRNVIIGDMMHIPHHQILGMLIDFSRAIINPYNDLVMARLTVSPDVLAQRQREYLIGFVAQCFPGDVKLLRAAEDLITRDFENAFCALSILDPIFALNAVRHELTDAAMLEFVDGLLAKCNAQLQAAIAAPKCEEFPIRRIVLENFCMVKIEPAHIRGMHVYDKNILVLVDDSSSMQKIDDPQCILSKIKN